MLRASGVKTVKLLPRSPNLNAYAERFVRSIKESCLDQFVLFGESSLRKAVQEFMAHYHRDGITKGLKTALITPDPIVPPKSGTVGLRNTGGLDQRSADPA